jgi:hypothetical protein
MRTPFNLGPLALTNTYTTNIMNPGTTTGGTNGGGSRNLYIILNHIHILNKTAGAVTFKLYKGATGGNVAGTEFMGTDVSVAANSYVDFYGEFLFKVADFLVGGASASTSLTIEAEGEIGVEL